MEILTHPNAALAQVAGKVDPLNDSSLLGLAQSMARAMYAAPGVGLAAPQIGVLKRVIVYDITENSDTPIALCNPVIVEYGEQTEVDDEGCLSLPGITVPVERSLHVVCEATSLKGTHVRIEADGLHARVLQHEIDHLDGIIMIDRATPEERKAAIRRYLDVASSSMHPTHAAI